MLTIKMIGAILIIISSAAIGMFYSTKIKDRTDHLRELKRIIMNLRGDIRYASTPLPEAIDMLARKENGNYTEFFQGIMYSIQEASGISFQEIWEKNVDCQLNKTALNKKDKMCLLILGENLGYLDKEMQLNTIDLYLAQLEDEIVESTRVMKEKVRLYNLLGFVGGIFITIIMI